MAWKDGRRVAFQCKRVKTFTAADTKMEIKKLRKLPLDQQPQELVFVTSQPVTDDTRRAARTAWGAEESCEFWSGDELDERVKRYPEIVQHFFWLPIEPKRPTACHSLHFSSPSTLFQSREEMLANLGSFFFSEHQLLADGVVRVQDTEDTGSLTLGTAFFVTRDLAFTCARVVGSAEREVWLSWPESRRRPVRAKPRLFGKPLMGIDDVAVLEIMGKVEANIPFWPLQSELLGEDNTLQGFSSDRAAWDYLTLRLVGPHGTQGLLEAQIVEGPSLEKSCFRGAPVASRRCPGTIGMVVGAHHDDPKSPLIVPVGRLCWLISKAQLLRHDKQLAETVTNLCDNLDISNVRTDVIQHLFEAASRANGILKATPEDALKFALFQLAQMIADPDQHATPLMRFLDSLKAYLDVRGKVAIDEFAKSSGDRKRSDVSDASGKEKLSPSRLLYRIDCPPTAEPFSVHSDANCSITAYLISGTEVVSLTRNDSSLGKESAGYSFTETFKKNANRLRPFQGSPEELAIEVFLPRHLLTIDSSAWLVPTRGNDVSAGASYVLVVRNSDQSLLEDSRVEILEIRQRRWMKLLGHKGSCLQSEYASAPPPDRDVPVALWLDRHSAATEHANLKLNNIKTLSVVMPYKPLHVEDDLERVISFGLPIVLFFHKDCDEVGAKVELRQLLDLEPWERLPAALQRIREKSVFPEGRASLLAHHLSLLWDDPTTRFPDDEPDCAFFELGS